MNLVIRPVLFVIILAASIDMKAWREKFVGGNKEDWDFFDSSAAGLITSAYAEIWGR